MEEVEDILTKRRKLNTRFVGPKRPTGWTAPPQPESGPEDTRTGIRIRMKGYQLTDGSGYGSFVHRTSVPLTKTKPLSWNWDETSNPSLHLSGPNLKWFTEGSRKSFWSPHGQPAVRYNDPDWVYGKGRLIVNLRSKTSQNIRKTHLVKYLRDESGIYNTKVELLPGTNLSEIGAAGGRLIQAGRWDENPYTRKPKWAARLGLTYRDTRIVRDNPPFKIEGGNMLGRIAAVPLTTRPLYLGSTAFERALGRRATSVPAWPSERARDNAIRQFGGRWDRRVRVWAAPTPTPTTPNPGTLLPASSGNSS